MIDLKSLFIILIALIKVAACERDNSTQIKPPFSQLRLPAYTSIFDAAQGDTLVLKNGTTVVVPPHAFIDQEGKTVKGEVKLVHREMKNQEDILISGIPMNTLHGEKMRALESAIMWEIRAYQDSTELALDSLNGKTLQTRIASNTPGSEYDLYYLDEYEEGWKQIAGVTPQENERYTEALVRGTKASRDAQNMDLSKTFVLNYITHIDVYDKPGDTLFNYFNPKFNPGNDVVRALMEQKVKSYGSTWLRPIPLEQTASFKGDEYPAALLLWETDKAVPRWLNDLKDAPYLEVIVKKLRRKKHGNDLYKMIFKKASWTPDHGLKWKVVHRMTAWPKMVLRDLYSQQAALRTEAYNSLLRYAKEQQEIAKNQDKIIRAFEIRNMGVYNYDKPFSPEEMVVKADFLVRDQPLNRAQDIFVLPEGRNTVIRYDAHQLDQFRIYPQVPVSIFTVGKNDSLFMVEPSRMSRIDFRQLRLYTEKPILSFELAPTDYVIRSAAELTAFIDEVGQTPTASKQ